MSEEDPPYPMPPSVIMQLRVEMTWAIKRTNPSLPLMVISSWKLKWHKQWRELILPSTHWSSTVESWSKMSNKEDPPYPPPIGHHAVESWNDMSNEENPLFPTPNGHQQLRVEMTWAIKRTNPTLPLMVISSWKLKWHKQWRELTLPSTHWSSTVESWSKMSNKEDPPYPPPIGHHAVESWNDMSNEENPLFPTPNGHQQLRVEMTWAIKRTNPTLPLLVISSWELKWHVHWGGPTLPYFPLISLQQLRVEMTWLVRRTHPTLCPHQSSCSWELKWHEQWGGPTQPYLL